MKALITQSNYIPWKGYFDNIAEADVFVVYDDMQYTKRDWRNRNKIKANNGTKWLSIPVEVKGKYFQKINETKVSDPMWSKKHLDTLKGIYAKAPFFKASKDWLENLYMTCNSEWLTEINVHFIQAINTYLGIETTIKDSRDFTLEEGKTEKLVGICNQLGATDYITGPAAKAYMEEELFTKDQINIIYSDYSGYSEYDQLYPPFEHGVTMLDVIFHAGTDAKRYLKQMQ